MKRMHLRERGFTMAEAIIAITILGLMGALVFGTFGHALDARERAETITDHYHQVRQAMLRMTREIQMAFVSEHRDCDDARTETLFVGKSASNGMRLDFTSFSHFKMQSDANESDQNELSYFVAPHPHPDAIPGEHIDGLVLMRREQKRIDEEADEGGVEQVMAEHVVSLHFEFYDPKQDRWENEWSTKDRDYKGRLPKFVSIKLKVKGLDGKDEIFITKTRIHLERSIKILGNGFAACID